MNSVVHAIRKFNRFYTNILGLLEQHLLQSDYSLSEARVLFEIGHDENCTATMLIDKLRLDAGYLSRILKRFEKQELICRVRSEEDGRLYHLSLTDRGREILSRLNALSDEQIRRLINPLPENERSRVAHHMASIERVLSLNDTAAPEVRIRTDLRPGDVGSLIHLHGWIYAQECGYNHVFEGYVCQTFADFFNGYNPEKDRFWIAEDGEQIVGAIAIVGHSEHTGQLRWFILHPEYRGIGLGKTLLRQSVQYCKEKGYRRVFLETTEDQKTAIAMYEKEGFRQVAEHHNRAWGVDHVELTYELLLP